MNKEQILARLAVLGFQTRPASASMQLSYLYKEDEAPVVLITFDDGNEQVNQIFTPALFDCDEVTVSAVYTDDDIRAAIYGGPSPFDGQDIIEGEDGFVDHNKRFKEEDVSWDRIPGIQEARQGLEETIKPKVVLDPVREAALDERGQRLAGQASSRQIGENGIWVHKDDSRYLDFIRDAQEKGLYPKPGHSDYDDFDARR